MTATSSHRVVVLVSLAMMALALMVVTTMIVVVGKWTLIASISSSNNNHANHIHNRWNSEASSSTRNSHLATTTKRPPMVVLSSSSSKSLVSATVPVITVMEQPSSPSSSPRLLLCGMDGRVQMVEARTGQTIGPGFTTKRPLLTTATVRLSSHTWHVVPSWDGVLYFLPQSQQSQQQNSAPPTSSSSPSSSSNSASISPSIMAPLSISHLLQHPVQTCTATSTTTATTTSTTLNDNNNNNQNHHMECGIITATKVTSLWAVDALTGELKWHRAGSGGGGGAINMTKTTPTTTATSSDTTTEDTASSSTSVPSFWETIHTSKSDTSSTSTSSSSSMLLLLQREDYLIQQVSVATGQVQWNVSVADYQALDFPSPPLHMRMAKSTKSSTTNSASSSSTASSSNSESERLEWSKDQLLLPSQQNQQQQQQSSTSSSSTTSNTKESSSTSPSSLPLISFGGEQSQRLVALDDKHPDRVLWTCHFGQMIASVFGVDAQQQWTPLQVVVGGLQDDDENDNDNEYDEEYDRDRDDEYDSRHDMDPVVGKQEQQQQQRLPLLQPHRQLLPTGSGTDDSLITSDTIAGGEDLESRYQDGRHGIVPLNRHLQQQQDGYQFPKYLPGQSTLPRQRQKRRRSASATSSSSNASPLRIDALNLYPRPQQQQQQPTSASMALATIPATTEDASIHNEHQDVYDYHSHYNFLQDFYNQQQSHHHHQNNNPALPPSIPLLFLPSPTTSSSTSPSSSGLLVMSRTTASILVVLWMIVWGMGGRWWYLRKKQQWLEQMDTATTPTVSATTTADSSSRSNSSSGDGGGDHVNENVNDKVHHDDDTSATIHGNAATTHSSKSGNTTTTTTAPTMTYTDRPVASSADRPDGGMMVTRSASGDGTAAVAAATNDGTILVDGIIPLLRYSRYKSEFRQMEHLGRGGFGSVVRCQNVLDGREYAIKKIIIDDDLNKKDQPFSQRLHRVLREVKSLALLDHVNVVRYYTAWLEHGDISKEEDDGQQHLQDSYYDGGGGGGASSKLMTMMTTTTDPEKRLESTSNNIRSWMGSASSFTDNNQVAALRRRPSGNHWSSAIFQSSVLGRSADSYQKNWCHHDESFSQSLRHSIHQTGSWEDYGFTFQHSETGETKVDESKSLLSAAPDLPAAGDTGDGSHDDSHSTTLNLQGGDKGRQPPNDGSSKNCSAKAKGLEQVLTPPARHTLYIQMQLCSQKTLGDFLANAEARRGTSRAVAPGCIDIPYALSLFYQIAQGVQHVHRQGLIHRDLKPNNCFIDEGGVVKVGDFGLSREASSSSSSGDLIEGITLDMESEVGPDGEFNTAGVGTRSYASPEQMNGSDYDSSTDVYSLGVMLFEICYPMYTGMERHIVFNKLRGLEFPDQWHRDVASLFPALHSLVVAMLSPRPKERPTADAVVQQIQSLLGEITILSLDRSKQADGSILLRVEAAPTEGVLQRTMHLIQEAAPDVEIVEYGLRGGNQTSIMEFALLFPVAETTEQHRDMSSFVNRIMSRIESNEDTRFVRQVSSGFRMTSREN